MLQKGWCLQDAAMDVVARTHDTEDDPFRKLCLILSRDVPLQNICVVKKFQCVLIWMGKTGMLTS